MKEKQKADAEVRTPHTKNVWNNIELYVLIQKWSM